MTPLLTTSQGDIIGILHTLCVWLLFLNDAQRQSCYGRH